MPTLPSQEGSPYFTPGGLRQRSHMQPLPAAARLPSVSAIPTLPLQKKPYPSLDSRRGLAHSSISNRCLPPRASRMLHLREGDIPTTPQAFPHFQKLTAVCRCVPPGCRAPRGHSYPRLSLEGAIPTPPSMTGYVHACTPRGTMHTPLTPPDACRHAPPA